MKAAPLALAVLLLSCGDSTGARGTPDAGADSDGDADTDDDVDADSDADGDADADADADADTDADADADGDGPPIVCVEQCRYVRAGAAGDGRDWDAALPDLPADLERGRVYLLADGSYAHPVLDDEPDGEALIVVRKAVPGDHGTDAGWRDEYGAGPAVFEGGLTLSTGHYTVDGTRGGGPGRWEEGHGIVVRGSVDAPQFVDSDADHITLRHVEIDAGQDGPSDVRGMVLYAMDDFTLSHAFLHDAGCDLISMNEMNRFTIEYSKLARNRQAEPGCHGDLIEYQIGDATTFVIRHNFFEDVVGSYAFGSHGPTITGYEIHGNVFYWSEETFFGNGLVGCLSGGGRLDDLRFHHNTLSGAFGGQMAFGILRGTGNEAFNNVWHAAGEGAFSIGWEDALHAENTIYNGTGDSGEEELVGDPFVDAAAGDVGLAAPTTPGRELGPPFDQDMLGTPRGADGSWDRGALELVR
jgi:hypothetical protein